MNPSLEQKLKFNKPTSLVALLKPEKKLLWAVHIGKGLYTKRKRDLKKYFQTLQAEILLNNIAKRLLVNYLHVKKAEDMKVLIIL